MKFHIVVIVAVVIATNGASCGVIGGAYDMVSNTTRAVKDDVYGWWSYGVDTVMGEDHNDPAPTESPDQSWLIGRVYNKVKSGVSSGYMKVHNFVLGEDSDPNKTIIRTLYERALKRLSDIKSFIFGDGHQTEKPESHNSQKHEVEKEEVLKLLFSNKTDIFNTESEKSALESLRSKLTRSGDEVLNLANNERDLIRKAYDTVRQKSTDLLTNAKETAEKARNQINDNIEVNANKVKNQVSENIEKTQEFIKDESKKFSEAAQNVEEQAKKASDNLKKSVQSE